MNYPTTLPLSATAVNICDGSFSPLYDIVWSIKYKITDWSDRDDYGLCFFLRDGSPSLSGRPGGARGIDLGYSGTAGQSTVEPDVEVNGMTGGILGIGLDTHGLFAANTTWPGGRQRSGITNFKKNSITLRGSSDSDFEYLNVHYPISAFNLLSNGTKILRARLGNYGRTIFLDYREEGDTDFINILTEDVELDIRPDIRFTPGISFVKPLTSSSVSFNIVVDTFHIEGRETMPDITTEYPEPLLPIECNSIYGGERIADKPDVNFPIIPPVKGVTMCNPAQNAELELVVDAPSESKRRGDIINYKIGVTNNGPQVASNVILYNNVTRSERLSATGDISLFTSGTALSAGATAGVEFSYKVKGTEGDSHITKTSVTSLFDEPKSVITAVPIEAGQFKFKINTKLGLSRTFLLPLIESGEYNFIVDWGDGFTDEITEYNSPNAAHKYNVDNEYIVTVTGILSGWQFDNDIYQSKLQYIDTLEWTGLYITTNAAFSGCSNYTGKIIAKGAPTITTTDLSYSFADCSLFNGNISNWDIVNVENLDYMFSKAYSFDKILASWNVSSLRTADNFLSGGSGEYSFTTNSYDKTILGWYNLSKNTSEFAIGVTLGVDQFREDKTQYMQLSSVNSWIFNDLGALV